MRDINSIFGKLLFSTEDEVRFIAKHSQDRLERALARLLLLMVDRLTVDYAGQKREKNGQFGKGKKPKTAPSAKPGKSSNAKSSEQAGKQRQTANKEYENTAGKHTASQTQSERIEGTAEKQLRQALMSFPKENLSGIERHICNEAWVKQRDAALRSGILPKSGVTIGAQRMRTLVRNRLKSGDFTVERGWYGDARAYMRFDKPIGIVFYRDDRREIKATASKTLCIVFSKHTGYHFFPVEDKEGLS